MKFKIDKNDFLKLLQKTQNIIEKRNTMPMLSNALLSAEKGKLKIYATDLEISIKDECDAEVENPGKVAVNAKNLFDLVKELSDGVVDVFKKPNHWLEIRSKKALFNLVGVAPEEFPAFPEIDVKEFAKVQSAVLQDMIEKTIYSVSHDETRYHLNGVFFEKINNKEKETKFRMVATDGHRLSLIDKKLELSLGAKQEAPSGVIIPKKGLYELKKLIENGQDTIQMGLEGSHLVVKKDSTTLYIRLIDGKYPNYQQLIPAKLARTVGVSKEQLLSSLRRVSLLSNQKSKGITMSINKNTMEIYSNNPELGDAKEELEIKYEGDAFKIAFNAKYLMDILNNIHEEDVDIHLNDQLSPGIVRPSSDSTYTCVVMPMRI
ncbi:MAG: DNA polymerase III subunit beta [Oligoflexia bacterium]|nr:DNA polymerase III subunit beta [Oligoflexia bacterium]